MKRLLLLSFVFLVSTTISLAQCSQGIAYATGTAPAPGSNLDITTCNYAGEYNTVNGVVSGYDYVVTGTGGAGNYFTIYDNTLTVVAFGLSPVSFTAASSGTFYTQVNIDAACATENVCRAVNWSNVSPPPPCPAVVAPWTETLTTTVNPPCWTQSSTTGGPWTYTGNPGYDVAGTLDHTNGSVNNYAWMDFSGTDVGVILTTPEIDVTALTVPELRFWEVSHYLGALATYNTLYVEAWDGAAWQLVNSYQGETGAAWVEHTAILSPYIYNTNFVQVRFRAESSGLGNDFYNDLLLDDISVVEAPTCPQPINLMIDSADLTTVSLSWTPTGSETEWYVEYGPQGFAPGTGAGTVAPLVTPNPWTTITGLPSNSFYDAYVRAFCTAGDTSFYTGATTFNTYDQGLYMEWDTECGPGFNDISLTGTPLDLLYAGEMDFALPFDFVYQGELIQNIAFTSSGYIMLEAAPGQFSATFNQTIDNAIYWGLFPFWEAIEADFGNQYYQTIGTAPNQTFIVQWDDNNYLNGPNGELVTFQLIMEEATGEIYFLYDDVEFGGSDAAFDYGNQATIGVNGPGQNLQVSYNNTNFLENNSCAHFYYTNCAVPTNFSVTYTTTDEGAVTWGAGLAGESNWTVIYGPAGFDPTQTGTSVSTSTPALIMPGLNDITTYDVYIYADCGPGTQSNGYMGSFTTLPNCADPTGIAAATAVDSLFSVWSWTENVGYPSTGFGVDFGWTGYEGGTGTTVWVDNNFTDTTADNSLIGGGVYQVYVQAVCGTDSSNWSGPVTFTMPLTNDSTCFAEGLAVDGTFYTFNNAGATVDANELSIAPPTTGFQTQDGWGNSNVNSSVWFTFTAPASGNVRANAAGINFDGQLAAYEVTDCNDFTAYTLLGANDDGPNNVNPPLLNLCGLTPGDQYYLMYDPFSTTATGTYNLTLTDVDITAGTDNGLVDICLGDTADLFNNISGNDFGGIWYENIPTANFSGSNFVSAGLASQVFGFEYIVTDGCAADTVSAQVEIYAPSSAGDDGTIFACQNEPINLLSGLSGNVDIGGDWYDPTNTIITDVNIITSSIPGQFNYDYITGNGVCPNDSANVIVDVDFNCDYLNLQDLYFTTMDLYPNPTKGVVYISNEGSNEVFNLELTDLNGKVIATQSGAINGTETTEVSLDKFETGIYLIRIFNDNAEKTFRVIKQ